MCLEHQAGHLIPNLSPMAHLSLFCRVGPVFSNLHQLEVNLPCWQLSNQNKAKQQVCNAKVKNQWTRLRIEVAEQEENALKTAPVGLQEGAGGLSFTVVCVPKGMHGSPRVRDDYTAAVTRWVDSLQRWKLIIVSVKQTKAKGESIQAES